MTNPSPSSEYSAQQPYPQPPRPGYAPAGPTSSMAIANLAVSLLEG